MFCFVWWHLFFSSVSVSVSVCVNVSVFGPRKSSCGMSISKRFNVEELTKTGRNILTHSEGIIKLRGS